MDCSYETEWTDGVKCLCITWLYKMYRKAEFMFYEMKLQDILVKNDGNS